MVSLWFIVGCAGILGGVANYLSARQAVASQKKTSKRLETYLNSKEAVLNCIVQSVIASSLMMGILVLFARESVDAIAKDEFRQFSLFALCVAAAMLGDKFTSPLLRKLTTEIDSLELRSKVLEKAHTEPDETSLSHLNARPDGAEDDPPTLVLKALSQSKWVYRSEDGLLHSTGLTEDELNEVLNQLKSEGQILSTTLEDGSVKWYPNPDYGSSS